MAVAMVRRYSRGIGLTRCPRLTGTPGHSRAMICATRCSWAGLTKDHSRLTAMASTPARCSRSTAAATSVSSSGSTSLPSESIRPPTSTVRLRGNERLWIIQPPVPRLLARCLTQRQHVGMAACGDQAGRGGRAGDDGIGRYRGAVDDHAGAGEQRLEGQIELFRPPRPGRS